MGMRAHWYRLIGGVRRLGVWAAVLVLLLGPLSVLAGPISAEEKQAIMRATERQVRDHAFAVGVDFDRWPKILESYQKRLDGASTSEEFTFMVNRALNEFGISHIDLLNPAMAEASKGSTFPGIGVSFDRSRNPVIQRVLPNSPAERAGLMVGDVLLLADGKEINGNTSVLRGPVDTTVTVTVRRGENELSMLITRAKVSFREVETLKPIGEDAAVLRIPAFTSDYDRSAVGRLMREAVGKKYLIIDLRSNPGGEVRNLLHFLGFLLPDGTPIGTSVTREMTKQYADETGGDPADLPAIGKWAREKFVVSRSSYRQFKGKIAVLVNGQSASASEIVSSALMELREAVLVGSRTAGAVLVSTYEDMPGGFKMKVPHSEYVSIKGRRIEGNPLKPDVAVSRRDLISGATVEEDGAVRAALAKLRGEAGVVEAPKKEQPVEQR